MSNETSSPPRGRGMGPERGGAQAGSTAGTALTGGSKPEPADNALSRETRRCATNSFPSRTNTNCIKEMH